MNLAVSDQAGGPAAVPAKPEPGRQASQLLSALFRRQENAGKLTILDVGRALPETVTFCSAISCRIHVVDLFEVLRGGGLDPEGSGKTLQRQFQELLGFASGTRLDICLLWDFPHYLDEKQLRAFSGALFPWLQPHTLGHVFGVHSGATQLLNREYGIVDERHLSVRTRTTPPMKCKPHPQSFMGEWLTCFRNVRGVLLPDGKIETLLQATV